MHLYLALESLRWLSSSFPDSERCRLISRSHTWSVKDLNTVFINLQKEKKPLNNEEKDRSIQKRVADQLGTHVLMEKSERRDATGARIRPHQNTGDESSI